MAPADADPCLARLLHPTLGGVVGVPRDDDDDRWRLCDVWESLGVRDELTSHSLSWHVACVAASQPLPQPVFWYRRSGGAAVGDCKRGRLYDVRSVPQLRAIAAVVWMLHQRHGAPGQTVLRALADRWQRQPQAVDVGR